MALEMKYFVLKPRSKYFKDPYAEASRKAMFAYADKICATDKELACSLRKWASDETNRNLELEEVDI